MKHIGFPEIGQYRNLIRSVTERSRYAGKDANGDPVYDHNLPLPTLQFEGTVKLHGTNAAICYNHDTNELWYQSRERIITVDNDNAGFVQHFVDKDTVSFFKQQLLDDRQIGISCIYGEWCGGSIQKGVGINGLPKMFVIFSIRHEDEWLPREEVVRVHAPEFSTYNIYDYDTRQITINFADPISYQNTLSELTIAVENACPVAKAFGKDGVGEGIVWKCITPGWEDSRFWMKVKGEKHSVSKVKTLAPVDMELVKNQKEFITNTVTEARCLQSISKLKESNKPLDRTSLGDFLRWIFNDIQKEDSELAKASGLDLEKMGGQISAAARTWFFKNEATFPL